MQCRSSIARSGAPCGARAAQPHSVSPVTSAPVRCGGSLRAITGSQGVATSHRVVTAAATKPAAKGFGDPKKKPGSGKTLDAKTSCPCGSGAPYGECCSKYHTGEASASTPEALLRSRYCAYFAKNAEYIADTTHPESPEYTGSKAVYLTSVKASQKRMDLQKLQLFKEEPGKAPEEVFITFQIDFYDAQGAHTKGSKGDLTVRTEKSRFLKANGKWLFIDSEFVQPDRSFPKITLG
ncbi:hypothetical protein FOA52_005713 [Chlamydomonas sp. UWO 241]|nr:hypothetical protein FOA52_005713 [Chlamydomonas sp. UWO 241]